jgi:Zn-dependent protease
MPIGGMAEMDDIPRQPWREFLITLAGPAVNFAIAAALWGFLHVVSFPADSDPDYSVPAFATELLVWNIWMGIFNLLPAFPMDGGRILRALLATRMRYVRATFWAATVGKVVAVLGALIAILIFQRWMPALLFAFIFYVGEMELRAVRRRELEDAHWRAVLARAYASSLPPPTEEPPVLTG